MSQAANEEGAPRSRPTHPVDEVLPTGRLAVLGFQHVLAMYAGAVAVPLILANAIGLSGEELVYLINADLFTCGVATLIQTVGFWKVGFRLPIIQGVTFAAVTPMILIGEAGGLTAIYGSVIVAGIITFLVSPYFSRLLRFFPPVVIGSIITVIGVSLLPVAVTWAGGGDPSAENFGSPGNIALAFAVLVIILTIYRFFGGFISRIAVLLGLIIGTIIATIVASDRLRRGRRSGRLWHHHALFLRFADLPVRSDPVHGPRHAGDDGRDHRKRCGGGRDRGQADPGGQPDRGAACGWSVHRARWGPELLPLHGVRPERRACAPHRVKSRWVVTAAGVFLILLGLFPKLAAVVAAIPLPVLGGAGFALFGTVAATGIRTLSRVDFERNANVIIVAISLAVGIIPVAVQDFYSGFPPGVQIVLNSGYHRRQHRCHES